MPYGLDMGSKASRGPKKSGFLRPRRVGPYSGVGTFEKGWFRDVRYEVPGYGPSVVPGIFSRDLGGPIPDREFGNSPGFRQPNESRWSEVDRELGESRSGIRRESIGN